MKILNRALLEREGIAGVDPRAVFDKTYDERVAFERRPWVFQCYEMMEMP